MRRGAIALTGIAVALAAPAAAEAQQRFCGPSDRSCTRLVVPLDRTGAVPGRLSLLVERQRPRRPSRPPLFVLAGGPGQSATATFDRDSLDAMLGRERRRREVVIVDQRGTGGSGLLRCPLAQRADSPSAVADCARRVGARSSFFATSDSVADLEQVRREFRYDRIALFGVSYGTKLALAYAGRHPNRVERLVLDSPVGEEGPSAFSLDTLVAIPRVLTRLCRRACRSFAPDPVRDIGRLSRRLGERRIRGYVVGPRGRRRPAGLTRAELFALIAAGDFDLTSREELPGAVRSAVRGDPAPLLRLARRSGQLEAGAFEDPRVLSAGSFLATRCVDGPFPWDRSAPPAGRIAQAAEAARTLPATAFGPFDAGAALDATGELALCAQWPGAGAGALPPTELPRVPALLLSGEQDVRTPTEVARRILRRLPGGRLLVVRGAGHDVVGSDLDGCSRNAVRRFLAGSTPPRRCPAAPLRPMAPAPVSLRDVRPVRGVRGRRGRVLAATGATVRDAGRELYFILIAFVSQAFTDPDSLGDKPPAFRVGGLRGGSLRLVPRGEQLWLVFRRLVYVPGVRVSGRVSDRNRGVLRVSGPRIPDGRLRVRGRRVSGRLGGRRVAARLDFAPDLGGALGAAARSSQRLVPPGTP